MAPLAIALVARGTMPENRAIAPSDSMTSNTSAMGLVLLFSTVPLSLLRDMIRVRATSSCGDLIVSGEGTQEEGCER